MSKKKVHTSESLLIPAQCVVSMFCSNYTCSGGVFCVMRCSGMPLLLLLLLLLLVWWCCVMYRLNSVHLASLRDAVPPARSITIGFSFVLTLITDITGGCSTA